MLFALNLGETAFEKLEEIFSVVKQIRFLTYFSLTIILTRSKIHKNILNNQIIFKKP
jgi:hypothetical protein